MLTEAEDLVRRHMAQYDPSHDWAHVDRVRRTALRIATTVHPAPDMLVVELVALFHDLAVPAKYGPTDALETTLEPFFQSATSSGSLTLAQQTLVLKIIPNISWSTEKKLRSQGAWSEWHKTCSELHAVQDADRLDAIGAVGILRCAAYSGAKGRKLVADEIGDDTAESHFGDKLLLIKDRMKTAWGREEALKRHETVWCLNTQHHGMSN
ncbi:hypothetical protein DB88DRAFT_479030 [Papiliotrema laurentii]|uniref:HD/PDEase domain-containing protein n=1 Tax=Papiliotrema laurentii TaxID=5418 RepID=A0AAD9FWV5_PAPLA|nr:hypothetical protein DB88DRAFT_479030 [Papiliotrema laurentii]